MLLTFQKTRYTTNFLIFNPYEYTILRYVVQNTTTVYLWFFHNKSYSPLITKCIKGLQPINYCVTHHYLLPSTPSVHLSIPEPTANARSPKLYRPLSRRTDGKPLTYACN